MLARGMTNELMKKILILDNKSDDIFAQYYRVGELAGINLESDFPPSLQRIAISINYLPLELKELYGDDIPEYLQNRMMYMVMMHYVEKSVEGLESYKAGLAFISTENNVPSSFRFEGILLNFVTRNNYPKFWNVDTFLHGKKEVTFPTSTISHLDDMLLLSGGIGDQAECFCQANYQRVLVAGRATIEDHNYNTQFNTNLN